MGLGLPELAQLRTLIDSEIGSMPARTVTEAIERVMVEELPRLRQPAHISGGWRRLWAENGWRTSRRSPPATAQRTRS